MSEYSVEEVRPSVIREYARILHGYSQYANDAYGDSCRAIITHLNAYADLLEQIERARKGVTPEVVQIAVQAFATSLIEQREAGGRSHHKDMHAALLAIAHLLPSERGVAEVRCEVCNGTGEVVASDGEWRGECRACRYRGKPNPPAQAAQVDVIGMLEPLVREMETTTVPNVLLKQITLLGKFADASRKLISEAMNAPTAEPVAQGEAAGEIVPIYDPACSKVVLFNSDLPIGTKLYTAQPHAVPDQVRYALERCLLSQDALVCSIDKANPDDPYASLMVQEDIDVVRNWLAAPQSKEGAPAVNPLIDIAAAREVIASIRDESRDLSESSDLQDANWGSRFQHWADKLTAALPKE